MKNDLPTRIDIGCGLIAAVLLAAIVIHALFTGVGP
jgi:hypothetical protein